MKREAKTIQGNPIKHIRLEYFEIILYRICLITYLLASYIGQFLANYVVELFICPICLLIELLQKKPMSQIKGKNRLRNLTYSFKGVYVNKGFIDNNYIANQFDSVDRKIITSSFDSYAIIINSPLSPTSCL